MELTVPVMDECHYQKFCDTCHTEGWHYILPTGLQLHPNGMLTHSPSEFSRQDDAENTQRHAEKRAE
jgi:hypothetical protein